MEVLNNHVSLFETLFIGEMIHEIKESTISTTINECVFTFGELLVKLGMMGVLLENIVEHVHVMPVNTFGAQHVNDGDGENEDKKDDKADIPGFDKDLGGFLFVYSLRNQ